MYLFIETLFWVSCFTIFLTWVGFYLILFVLKGVASHSSIDSNKDQTSFFFVSVIIAAKNEEKNIEDRIQNLLGQDYPPDRFEIIVASDGSIDNTVPLLKKFNDPKIRVLDFKENRGRALVHNDAVIFAKGEIVVFTDAETKFSNNFLLKITAPFQNPEIGASVGRLVYSNRTETGITEAAYKYWDYEAKLRLLESRLGVLAFSSGACSAFRKKYYQNLLSIEDIDSAQTLNVVRQGLKIAFVPDAIAYDVIANTVSKTFKNRVRHTSKAFRSILSRLFTREIIKRPLLFLTILFHKTFRHLTPFFLLLIFITNIPLAGMGAFYRYMFFAQCVFYISSIIGITLNSKVKLPKLLVYLSNFLLINVGRFVGVLKAVRGEISATY
jgi:cellulose synthase/poly-beta-1,6-N-acetylglucosamine synthase-like glycosyltransferase